MPLESTRIVDPRPRRAARAGGTRAAVLYLSPGCFDKGGISRYNRYQIGALRDLLGPAAVRVFSIRGPGEGDFETPFEVTASAGGRDPERGATRAQKAALVARVAADALARRPGVIVAAHVHLASLALALARAVGARSVVDVYGLEVWSGLRPDAAWGLRAADLVVADCHFTAAYLREARLRPAGAPTAVLWDCVDTERFRPGPPDPGVWRRHGIPDPDRHVNVLTLGRLAPEAAHKGYDRLLDAFCRAAPSAPALRLVYAGKGALVPELRRRAEARGVGDRVAFTGPVHEDHLADVYRAAHVFSLVSDRGHRRGEGIPLTPLEAAACGVPILVGDQDGSQEAAVDEGTGFVLDPFDTAAHCDRLLRLAADPGLRVRMGNAARARILEHHDYRVFRAGVGRVLERLGVGAPGRAAEA